METFTETTLQELRSKTDILIPLYVDHPDRMKNLRFVLEYLRSGGFENVYVREYYNARSPEFEIHGLLDNPKNFTSLSMDATDNFNKMQCINEMVNMCDSEYLAIWDVDVLFPKRNINEALELLKKGVDVVYPYDGRFYNVPKDKFEDLKNGKVDLNGCELCNPKSWGGAVFFNRASFIEGGKCNPNFKNVGFDDNEIKMRFRRLGYNIQRTSGPLLHMDHFRSETSVENSPFINHNMAIYNHVANCPIEELKEEIKTWR